VGPVTRTINSEIRANLLLKKEARRDIFGDPDVEEQINFTTNLNLKRVTGFAQNWYWIG
jgi:hypothetical protein